MRDLCVFGRAISVFRSRGYVLRIRREAVLRAPTADACLEQRRTALCADIVNVYCGIAGRSHGNPGLAGIEVSLLGTVQQRQQGRADGGDDDVEPSEDMPPDDAFTCEDDEAPGDGATLDDNGAGWIPGCKFG